LGVGPLLAGRERYRPPAAGVYVKVQAVLDGLDVRHHLEPKARPVARGVDDAVRAMPEEGLRKPEVAIVVIPGSEPFRGRLQHIPEGGGPEARKRLRLGTVDHQLEPDTHRSPPEPARRSRPQPLQIAHFSLSRRVGYSFPGSLRGDPDRSSMSSILASRSLDRRSCRVRLPGRQPLPRRPSAPPHSSPASSRQADVPGRPQQRAARTTIWTPIAPTGFSRRGRTPSGETRNHALVRQ